MSALGTPAPSVPVAANSGWPVGVTPPPDNLIFEDGEPLESFWHRQAMNLLIELIQFLYAGRTDYFAGGNMFVYFSAQHVFNRDFRGPDVFLVKNVDGLRDRRGWVVWEEDGRYPDLIIELASPSTVDGDRTTKKDLYERTFRTPEYFLYDPATERLEGWRFDEHQRYSAISPEAQGRMWSEQLGVWLGTWRGRWHGPVESVWLRFYDANGQLVPLFDEAAQQQARKEKERADKLEAELTRLRALLAEKGPGTPPNAATSE